MTHRRRHAGFTLLEVLVAVGLLALLLTLAYASMRAAVQASRSGEALIARSEEMRTAQVFLRRQFAGTLPLPYEFDDRTGIQLMFEGSADSIRFVAPMPGYLSRGGPHVQELSVARARGGLQLEFNHSQLNGFLPDQPVGGDRDPVVLVDGIARAAFEFRSRETDGQLGPWTEHWDNPHLLPVQIRLRVEFPADDPRRWPDLEVPVMSASGGMLGSLGGQRRRSERPQGRVARPSE
jgi:general secretion pathway protein J